MTIKIYDKGDVFPEVEPTKGGVRVAWVKDNGSIKCWVSVDITEDRVFILNSGRTEEVSPSVTHAFKKLLKFIESRNPGKSIIAFVTKGLFGFFEKLGYAEDKTHIPFYKQI